MAPGRLAPAGFGFGFGAQCRAVRTSLQAVRKAQDEAAKARAIIIDLEDQLTQLRVAPPSIRIPPHPTNPHPMRHALPRSARVVARVSCGC